MELLNFIELIILQLKIMSAFFAMTIYILKTHKTLKMNTHLVTKFRWIYLALLSLKNIKIFIDTCTCI